jgi:hypothetical protein
MTNCFLLSEVGGNDWIESHARATTCHQKNSTSCAKLLKVQWDERYRTLPLFSGSCLLYRLIIRPWSWNSVLFRIIVKFVQVYKASHLWQYSKPSLIRLQLLRVWDNPDRNMKCEKYCSQLSTYYKRHMPFRKADESLVCSDKTWDSFFRPASLRSKSRRTSDEASIDE